MSKHISLILFVTGLVAVLSGCSESSNDQATTEQAKTAAATQEIVADSAMAQPETSHTDALSDATSKWKEQTKELGAAAWESTKEVAADAAETGKEYYGVAKEKTADAYEVTKEKSAELLEITKEKATDAYESAKKGTQEAWENSQKDGTDDSDHEEQPAAF